MQITRRVLLLAAVLGLLLAGAACSPEEETAFRSVNALRDQHGLRWLDWDEPAHAKAVAWSQHMADEGRLSHSVLSEGLPKGWRVLGENVAYAGSVEQAMATLEASAPHRANLLKPEFLRVGIGIVERDGRYWVTQVFIG